MTVIYLQLRHKAQRTRGICTHPIDASIAYLTPQERDGRARRWRHVHSNGTHLIHIRRESRALRELARLLSNIGWVSRTLKRSHKFNQRKGDLVMSRIMVGVAALVIPATMVIWSNVIHVKPEAAAALTKAPLEQERLMISPFDIMIMHGRNTPVEEWRDAI